MSWSYATYDHADWLERNAALAKHQDTKARRGATDRGWAGAPDVLPPFHRQVAHMLGIAFGGIYNAPIAWDRVEWGVGKWSYMRVPIRGELATFDGSAMTALVFLAHEACIRVAVQPWAPGHLRLIFTQRQRERGIMDGHPSLDERVAEFRAAIGPSHPVRRLAPEVAHG